MSDCGESAANIAGFPAQKNVLITGTHELVHLCSVFEFSNNLAAIRQQIEQ